VSSVYIPVIYRADMSERCKVKIVVAVELHNLKTHTFAVVFLYTVMCKDMSQILL